MIGYTTHYFFYTSEPGQASTLNVQQLRNGFK